MSYTPYTWVNGDVITATKLNHIEQGIKDNESSSGGNSGVLIVDVEETVENNESVLVLKTTFNNILSALRNGQMVVVRDDTYNQSGVIYIDFISGISASEEGEFYAVQTGNTFMQFSATSPTEFLKQAEIK